ncbi:MAG: hypothetical protein AAFP17_16160 [Pseudomonadota bacterium]
MDKSTSKNSGPQLTMKELQAQLDAVNEDLRILAQMAGQKARGEASAMRAEAEEKLSELSEEARAAFYAARDGLGEQGRAAYARGEEVFGEFEETIRRNPLAAIGIAAAAGWLIGQMTRR